MSEAVANAGFYADFGALTSLKKNVKADDPKAIREAARQFESLFTDMMLKSMRAAKLGDGLGDSQESEFYQDMYDQQLAVQMSQGKGLGLADMLVQQLTRSGVTGAASASASASGGGAAAAASGVSSSAASSSAAAATGTTVPTGHTVSTPRRISFIQSIEPYAQRAASQLGVSPDSVIAQAALETGWGEHVPASSSGASSYNLFGVKAGSGWQGASVKVPTQEYSQGSAVSAPQSFRVYSSLQQGVNDYVSLLRRSASYQSALGTGNNASAFADGLQRGGYATDPDYAHKLTSTVATVKALRIAAAAASLKFGAPLPTTNGANTA